MVVAVVVVAGQNIGGGGGGGGADTELYSGKIDGAITGRRSS